MTSAIRRVVSISEAAELCQVTAETIRRWVDQGEIPSKRTLGGHRRIDLKDFQDFLKKRNLGKVHSQNVKETKTLIVGSDDQMCSRLLKVIRETSPQTEVTVVQSSFEAGQKIAIEEPDYVFFVSGLEGLDIPSAVHSIRENVRTRMVRIISVGIPETPIRKSGADFTVLDPIDKEMIRGIYHFSDF